MVVLAAVYSTASASTASTQVKKGGEAEPAKKDAADKPVGLVADNSTAAEESSLWPTLKFLLFGGKTDGAVGCTPTTTSPSTGSATEAQIGTEIPPAADQYEDVTLTATIHVYEDGEMKLVEDTSGFTVKWFIADGQSMTTLEGTEVSYAWQNAGEGYIWVELYNQDGTRLDYTEPADPKTIYISEAEEGSIILNLDPISGTQYEDTALSAHLNMVDPDGGLSQINESAGYSIVWNIIDSDLDPDPITGQNTSYAWQNHGTWTVSVDTYDPTGELVAQTSQNAYISEAGNGCESAPTYVLYTQTPTDIIEYSDTEVTYDLSGIAECGEFLAEDAVYAENLAEFEAGGYGAVTESYDASTGDYLLVVQFYGTPDVSYGDYFNLVMEGESATTEKQLWFPTISSVYIVQEQANAGTLSTIALNEIPSGSSNFTWTVDGTEAGTDESLTHIFADPGTAWPASVSVEVSFDTGYGDTATISRDIEVYPASE